MSAITLGSHSLASRLILGTGKYTDNDTMLRALEASGTEMVTVAVRRLDLTNADGPNLLEVLDGNYIILPNTAGCYTAEDAIRTAHIARELSGNKLIKLEVLGDERTLLPDPVATIEATAQLVGDGFTVMVYTSDDPIVAQRLQDAGATSVMPAGSPIGSGQGVLNPNNIRIILESLSVPVIVDAGVGTASDVTLAMELGVEGILMNTGVALADDPVKMAATQITFSKLSRTVRGAALTGEVVQTVEWKWDAGSGKLTRRSALAFEAEDVFRSDKKSKKKTNSNISCQVDSARLEYFDGQRWLDKWDLKLKGRFPEKISLYLEFSEEESVKSYSVTTFPFIMESN